MTKSKTKRAPKPRTIFQIKIELKQIKPLIWRRVLVPSDIRLSRLHEVIQIAMGWTDSHLHEFDFDGMRFGPPPEEDFDWGGMEAMSEAKYRLDKVLEDAASQSFDYLYDFGDGWEHRIKVEKVFLEPDCPQAPYLITGKNNCPPEDCGGPYGYMEFLQAMADITHPQHESTMEWMDGMYLDFDPDEVNAIFNVKFKPKQV